MARWRMRRTLVAGLVLLVALLGGTASSAQPGRDGSGACSPGVHVLQVGSGRRALMRISPGAEGGKMALVLVLHAAGGSPEDGLRALRGGWNAPGLVLVAPAARGSAWSFGLGRGDDLPTVDHALTQAFSRCSIDRSRVGIGGFSDGATNALSLGVRNGRLFRAIIALSPGGIEAGTRLGKPRIFVAHGTRDGVHPFAGTRDALVPKLRREGYAVTFRAFVGGHVVPAPVSRAAVSWFLG